MESLPQIGNANRWRTVRLDCDPSKPLRPEVRSCLVLGGARSGKSSYAQDLAEGSGRPLVYLATATVWDGEMAERVALHRGARDARWRTVEEPLALAEAIGREAAGGPLIVVDCLTLWLTNVMLGGRDVAMECRSLAAQVASVPAPVIYVSNEVGSGIVPDNLLAREFRDAQGRLNQAMARACHTVVLVTAGLPLTLKPLAHSAPVF